MIAEEDLGKEKTEENDEEKRVEEANEKEEGDFEARRRMLVDGLEAMGVGKNVLEAMLRVPRHRFVRDDLQKVAYIDTPLDIGLDQTISAPHMVAVMCDLLELSEGQKVLEIGAGSGYNAAVMAELVGKSGHVYTVERLESLVNFARENLRKAGYENVTVLHEDGSIGCQKYAPYDRISVTCAAPEVPKPLIEQLKPGGIMAIPVGDYFQELILVKKDERGKVTKKTKGGVVFVPLIGKYGFRHR